MTPALLLAGTIAVWASVFSCYALAFRAQSPLLGLVPPLALIVFADSVLEEFIRPLYGIYFLIAALAVLFADSLRRIQGWGPVWTPTGARDRLLPIAGRNARRVGLTAVTLALLSPVLLPGFGEKAVFSLSSINSDHRIRLSPLVSMGAILNGADGDLELFSIETTRPSYWRMVTLDTNDGTTWQPTPDAGTPLASGQADPRRHPTSGKTVAQTVTVLQDGGFSWLVAAATPTSISIDHDVSWHPASSSLQMDGWPDAGRFLHGHLDQAAGVGQRTWSRWASRPSPPRRRCFRMSPSPRSSKTRRGNGRLACGTTSTGWRRSESISATSSSTTRACRTTDDPQSLADMLQTTHRGFCQQFASLMAIMLRSIGIPARVAVGFTTGTPTIAADGQTAYVVRMKNYHSWVEVPFQGYGWQPFDPTPGFPGDPSASYVTRRGSGSIVCPPQSRNCTSGGNKGNTDGTAAGPPQAEERGLMRGAERP